MDRFRGLREYLRNVLLAMVLVVGGSASAAIDLFPGAQWLGFVCLGFGLIGAAVTAYQVVRSGKAKRRAQLRSALVDFPPKRASSSDRHDLGVSKSNVVSTAANGNGQPYISRDVDDELDSALRAHPFVVVRGASKAGKSRTAFEAIVRQGDPLLFAARKGAAVADISENCDMLPSGPAVVWLDKLDGYVRAGLFDTFIRDELLNRAGLTIVGTIEDAAWDLIVNADGEAKGAYEAADVLQSAQTVWVGRASGGELKRAKELYPDEAFEASIGAHFVAARSLRDRYLGARSEKTAVVRAVVDWQRTGMPSPIPKRALEQLHVRYLGGADAADRFEERIAWANEADPSGARLLHAHGRLPPEYSVPDHIVEWLTKSEPAEIVSAAWDLAIENADADEAVAIGARALELYEREDFDPATAQAAFERALAQSKPNTRATRVAATRLAMLMRRLGHDDLAEPYFKQSIESESMVAGNNYGYMLMQQERFAEAKLVLAQAVERGSRTAAFNLLQTLADLDAIGEAGDLFGPEVERNPAAALMLGNVRHADDLEEADRLYALVEASEDDRDAGFRRRATVLRALIAEEQERYDDADSLYAGAGDPDEWNLIAERLDHVGLTEQLAALRDQVAARSG
jgi:hypothetical protein